jgi:hypothetical protein
VLRYGGLRPAPPRFTGLFGQQPERVQPAAPVAAVAGDIQHRETSGNLAA